MSSEWLMFSSSGLRIKNSGSPVAEKIMSFLWRPTADQQATIWFHLVSHHRASVYNQIQFDWQLGSIPRLLSDTVRMELT